MSTIIDPAILFFIFGVFAGLVKSNLEIPQPITRFLSLYLLMALGLKGGFALHQSGLTLAITTSLGIAIFLACIVPLVSYFFLKTKLSALDSAAIAATYGSVSAVTFITATQYLNHVQIEYGGHMAAAMALMESPAIILAIFLANRAKSSVSQTKQSLKVGKLLHESFTDGAQLLLLGAMLIGILSGPDGQKVMAPFSVDLFKGMLAFFLLDMGLMSAKSFADLKGKPRVLFLYAFIAPLCHSLLALSLCLLFQVELGNTILLMVLAASASYIAVPAVLRHALPEVSPALYMGMSLGITFPLNIIIGIPLYALIAKWALGS